MSNIKKERFHTFDETIKALIKENYKDVACGIMSEIKTDAKISIQDIHVQAPAMLETDFLVIVKTKNETYILHMEFEANLKSNEAIAKRILEYRASIKRYSNLPVYQVLVLLKEPKNIKNIKTSFTEKINGKTMVYHYYQVIKVYEMDKYEILKSNNLSMYPLRVFMKPVNETDEEHIKECLEAVNLLKDQNYYYLTARNLKRIYEKSKFEKIVKEEAYMYTYSDLYKEPYDEGIKMGISQGVIQNKKEMAQKAYLKGLDINLIVDLTGLPKKELSKIIEEQKLKSKVIN